MSNTKNELAKKNPQNKLLSMLVKWWRLLNQLNCVRTIPRAEILGAPFIQAHWGSIPSASFCNWDLAPFLPGGTHFPSASQMAVLCPIPLAPLSLGLEESFQVLISTSTPFSFSSPTYIQLWTSCHYHTILPTIPLCWRSPTEPGVTPSFLVEACGSSVHHGCPTSWWVQCPLRWSFQRPGSSTPWPLLQWSYWSPHIGCSLPCPYPWLCRGW